MIVDLKDSGTEPHIRELRGLTSRNFNYHPRHPGHSSQRAQHRWRAEITNLGSRLCCLPICHLGNSLHRWVSGTGSKNWRRWSFSSSSPMADPAGSLWLQGSSQKTTELKPTPCLQQPRLWTKKRDFLPTQCFWLTAGPSCRVFNHQEGSRSSATSENNKTSVTLQWIHSHCGVGADQLSKVGSKLEQSAHPMSYSKARTIVRSSFKTEWWQHLDIGTEEDSVHQLNRVAQVTILRLRTRHCQLLSHIHRLKISHSDECPCGTGLQTTNHIL